MNPRLRAVLVVLTLLLLAISGCSPDSAETPPPTESDLPRTVSPFRVVAEWVVVILEATGVLIIVLGLAGSSAAFIYRLLRLGPSKAGYESYREHLGEAILVGLEFLVAADIVNTVTVHPTLGNIGGLALIIVIRTFLSFTLEVETTGYWPWQRCVVRGTQDPVCRVD
ncbi:MAG: DUF1622 domain-containing protein [Anaerolineae bacterium]